MKKLIYLIALMSPIASMAFCNIPTMTSNTYQNQQLQQAFDQCLSNERFQQQQLQMQQQQLQVQQQQLQLQQQQMNGGGQINFNSIRPYGQ